MNLVKASHEGEPPSGLAADRDAGMNPDAILGEFPER